MSPSRARLIPGSLNDIVGGNAGGVVYSQGATLAVTAVGSSGQVLQSGGAGAPAWSTATYPAVATGTGKILRADGTNWVASTSTYPDTATAGDILYASGANVIGNLAVVAAGSILVSGSAPAWSAAPTITTSVHARFTLEERRRGRH